MNIDIPRERIADFCRRRRVVELALFGSVLRDDFGPDSDVDVLVSFAADARHSVFDHVDMEEELQGIFGRPVDLIVKGAVRNPFIRHHILHNHRVVYAAA
ncbi:MAG: nucleotidyltransferase family protein [Gemmatimonadota bacterium]|nr:nucleotidyltransferase family protein [Gemmatimonadota bacterium]